MCKKNSDTYRVFVVWREDDACYGHVTVQYGANHLYALECADHFFFLAEAFIEWWHNDYCER